MAATPKFKVYRGKEYIGCTKYAEDAAALCAVSNGGTVKYGHSLVIWREGKEDVSASESYDQAADTMLTRVNEANKRSYDRAYEPTARTKWRAACKIAGIDPNDPR